MSGQFTIALDHARRLIHVTMSGFFEAEDVLRYRAAIGEATEALGGTPQTQLMICDIGGMAIQKQDIVGAFHSFMSEPRYAGRRVAFVVASTLARQQLQRAVGTREVAMFATHMQAESWLTGQSAAA